MSDLLEFLNSATESDLQSKGLSATLSKRLVDARPYASTEDALKVKGLTAAKLGELESQFDAKPEVETQTETEVVAEVPAAEVKKPRVWVRVLRWVLVLLILAGAIYAAILYGVPFIYNTFLRPVENNTAQLSEVAALQKADSARLEEEIATLQARVTDLESRADAVDQALAAQSETLANLAAMQTELDQTLNAELTYQVNLLRAVNYLSRCRLYLSQSNFGLAREDALSARNLLSQMQPAVPAGQAYALNEAINRLDIALSNLPAYPVVAVYDIDIAWQYLADGLNETAPTLAAPTVAPTEATSLPKATSLPEATPLP
jgi:hypothetical protein